MLISCQNLNFPKIPANYRYDLHNEMWFCGEAALQYPEEKAGQKTLNFEEEIIWSRFDHDNLPGLQRQKIYIPST
jgi:hypothetical protein